MCTINYNTVSSSQCRTSLVGQERHRILPAGRLKGLGVNRLHAQAPVEREGKTPTTPPFPDV